MTSLRESVKSGLSRATANPRGQWCLEKSMSAVQYLLGVGAGTHVDSSGEIAVISRMRTLRDAPYRIFDVGSNTGQYLAMLLRELADTDVEIHCFEPSTRAFTELNELASKHVNIAVNNVALGRAPSEATLYYDCPGSGIASLTRRRMNHFGVDFDQAEPVTVTTIDDYCAARDIESIDLLKIDVEGHELDVLAGAERVLPTVRIVTFEFGGANIDTRTFVQDFYYLFAQKGMDLFRITPSGFLAPIREYGEPYELFRTTNFAAIRRTTR